MTLRPILAKVPAQRGRGGAAAGEAGGPRAGVAGGDAGGAGRGRWSHLTARPHRHVLKHSYDRVDYDNPCAHIQCRWRSALNGPATRGQVERVLRYDVGRHPLAEAAAAVLELQPSESEKDNVKDVGQRWPRSGANSSAYRCIPTGMHGPSCVCWAKLKPFSLKASAPSTCARPWRRRHRQPRAGGGAKFGHRSVYFIHVPPHKTTLSGV